VGSPNRKMATPKSQLIPDARLIFTRILLMYAGFIFLSQGSLSLHFSAIRTFGYNGPKRNEGGAVATTADKACGKDREAGSLLLQGVQRFESVNVDMSRRFKSRHHNGEMGGLVCTVFPSAWSARTHCDSVGRGTGLSWSSTSLGNGREISRYLAAIGVGYDFGGGIGTSGFAAATRDLVANGRSTARWFWKRLAHGATARLRHERAGSLLLTASSSSSAQTPLARLTLWVVDELDRDRLCCEGYGECVVEGANQSTA
jgi:hypothetical protein